MEYILLAYPLFRVNDNIQPLPLEFTNTDQTTTLGTMSATLCDQRVGSLLSHRVYKYKVL